MAEAPEICPFCDNTDSSKKLYPKIHFCGYIIWICSTCTIKEKQCNKCKEDLLDSQVDTKENLRHTQLFTDLTKAEERENRIIFQNENKCQNHKDVIAVSFCPQCECKFLCQDCSKQHCKKERKKDNKTKYHIIKHIGLIKECTEKKNSSPCVVHTDTNSDFFCCTHNVPVCFYCIYLQYHKTCTVKRFTESLEETRSKLNYFIETLESKERVCDDMGNLTEEFNHLSSRTDSHERELKKSAEDEYNKQYRRQKVRISGHIPLIKRVRESPPDAAFFDMTQTLAAIFNSIQKDISELNDVHEQMKSQDRSVDHEEVIKRLKAMSSGGSSHGDVKGLTSCDETVCTLYSTARSVSGPRGSLNINEPGMSHETENVVYVYTCTKCHKLYVGATDRKLIVRDGEHHRCKRDTIYKHKCEQDGEQGDEQNGKQEDEQNEEQEDELNEEQEDEQNEEQEDEQDGVKKQKHFVVSCVRKDLVDEDQRCMMETLIMLKLGTLQPDGINERLSRTVRISLEILRFQAWNGAAMELRSDDRTAFKTESTGSSSVVFSRDVLIFKNSYEVLLEEINNENATICVIFKNRGENTINPEWIPVPIQLPTGMLECRVGIDFYKQYGYVYVNGTRGSPIRLQENFEAKEYWAMFQACSKITGLPIQLQKTWIFTDKYASNRDRLTLSGNRRTAECTSEECIVSQKSMKLNILYEVFVEELYDDYNGLSRLGILLQTPEVRSEDFYIQLIKGSRYGVIVDAQNNLYLFVNGERKQTKKQCVIFPCYFCLRSKCLKVSTLSETTVFFN